MKKITIKINTFEFASLYSFCKNIFQYTKETELELISDSQLVLSDFYEAVLAQKFHKWETNKPESKPLNLSISFTVAVIVAKNLMSNRIDASLQSVLQKLDEKLVNNNYCLTKMISYANGTQNQVFGKVA